MANQPDNNAESWKIDLNQILYEGKPLPVLETPRLRLRPVRDEDEADLFALFGDAEVMHPALMSPFADLDAVRSQIQSMREGNEQGQSREWVLALNTNDRAIGMIGFGQLYLTQRGTVNWVLARAYWGQGYMTEAARALLRYGFMELELIRIEALVLPANGVSGHVLEKLGFTIEGILREYEYWNGTSHDLQMYSILRREYMAAVDRS